MTNTPLQERVTDDNGTLLWEEDYIFSHFHAIGERFIRDSQEYEVLSVVQTGASLIETTVRRVPRSFGGGA